MLGMHFTKRLLVSALVAFTAAPALAQNAPNQAQLRLVVVDQTGAGIPAATVTVKPATGEPIVFVADDHGVASSPALVPGAVTVQVEFPGFMPFEAPLTLKRGAMNETVTLAIEGFKAEVEVTQASAPEASKSTSTTALSQEEIDALPDDPEELADALSALAGPGGATFFMNGFSGGRLPNRDQIRSIRIRQNNYGADNHDAGRSQIEIVTRPNANWGGNGSVTLGGDAFNARQPQQSIETPSQERNVQFGLRGPIVAGKTSFSFTGSGNTRFNSNPIIAINESGSRINDAVRSTNDQAGFQFGLEHSLDQNHGLLFNLQRSTTEGLNQGVGGFNLPERASTRENDSTQFRARLQSVLGTKYLNEVRLQLTTTGNDATSASSASTIVVQDAFTRGGAGISSNSSTRRLELADNFDFTVGRHQMRVGALVEGAFYSNFDERNAAGTWTYRTIEDFVAGRPAQFSQRLGTVDTAFSQYQAGIYWSDEFRVHRDLSIGLGVRNELQSRIGDTLNLMPRAGFTWAPFKSGKTTLRGGAGIFYDWYEAQVYEQTLRVDGVRQSDLVVQNPGFPNPFVGGNVIALPSGRYVQDEGLTLPRTVRTSIGVEQTLARTARLNVSYAFLQTSGQFRGRNLNAPQEDGVRPNPEIGNITQIESTARAEGHMVNAGFNMNLPWHRVFMFVNYTWGDMKNESDGPFTLPANNLDPRAEWGPAMMDIRHRVGGMMNMDLWRGFKLATSWNASSGSPYNITTGHDDNADTVSNDRPEGFGRNAGRTKARWDAGARLSYAFGFGQRKQVDGGAGAPMVVIHRVGGGGDSSIGGFSGGADDHRFRFEVFVAATNIFNHMNPLGYSGVMTSPFFGQPTSAGAPRRIELGARFGF